MGLYVQREALLAAQKSLDITGNNITNVKTEGYSRQRLDVCSVANKGYNLFYDTSTSLAGQGVDQVGVTQIRDSMLDRKVRTYSTIAGELEQKTSAMADVETALDNIESEDSGFMVTLAKFKESLQAFSADNADRTELADNALSAAKAVVTQMNYLNNRLNDISEQTLNDTKGSVNKVNNILTSMGNLNKQISDSYISMGYISETTGNYKVDSDYGPLELKDEMNKLIDQLSEYGNVSFKEEANGSFTVSFADQVVVHNDQYAQMTMTETDPKPLDMAFVITDAGTYDPVTDRYSGLKNTKAWTDIVAQYGDTQSFTKQSADVIDITGADKLTGGSLKGYLDVYNGDGSYADTDGNTYKGIEFYRDMLNSLTTTMTESFNGVFETDFGFGIFACNDRTSGADDFHNAADNFRISDEWLNNPELISKPGDFNGTSQKYDELDNTYINKLLGVMQGSFDYGYTDANGVSHNESSDLTINEYVEHISNTLGSQVEGDKRLQTTNDIMLNSVVDARSEIMDVSINEEGINMINYQKWYNAISRMVTTMDEALDKLINGTGVVGL